MSKFNQLSSASRVSKPFNIAGAVKYSQDFSMAPSMSFRSAPGDGGFTTLRLLLLLLLFFCAASTLLWELFTTSAFLLSVPISKDKPRFFSNSAMTPFIVLNLGLILTRSLMLRSKNCFGLPRYMLGYDVIPKSLQRF